MTATQAWKLVSNKFPKMVPSIAYELEESFIFTLRPSNSSPLILTSVCILVNKDTQVLEGLPFGDPRARKGNFYKQLDISQFKEGGK